MAKGQQRDLKREAFWRKALGQFGKSGLNVRDFCARERLSEPSFYSWRRVIQDRDAELKRPRPRTLRSRLPAFMPVLVRGDQGISGDTSIVIELRGGPTALTLRLPTAMPVGQVAELVHALEVVAATKGPA